MPVRKKNVVEAPAAQASRLDALKNFMSDNAETIGTTAVFAGLSAWGLNTTTAEWISSRSAQIVAVAGATAIAANVVAKNGVKAAQYAYSKAPSYQGTKDAAKGVFLSAWNKLPAIRSQKAAEDKAEDKADKKADKKADEAKKPAARSRSKSRTR